MYQKIIKPSTDWIIALTALVILSPILLLTAIAIKIDSHGPVFFRQMRLGYKGREFSI